MREFEDEDNIKEMRFLLKLFLTIIGLIIGIAFFATSTMITRLRTLICGAAMPTPK